MILAPNSRFIQNNQLINVEEEEKILLRDALVEGKTLNIRSIQEHKFIKIEVHLINNKKTFEFELNLESNLQELRAKLEKIGIENFYFLCEDDPITDLEDEYQWQINNFAETGRINIEYQSSTRKTITQVVSVAYEEEIKESEIKKPHQELQNSKRFQPQDTLQKLQSISSSQNQINQPKGISVSISQNNYIKENDQPIFREIELENSQNNDNIGSKFKPKPSQENTNFEERIKLLCSNGQHQMIDELLASQTDEQQTLLLQIILQLPESEILAYQNYTKLIESDKKLNDINTKINTQVIAKNWNICNQILSEYMVTDSFKVKYLYVTQLRNFKEITPLVIPQDPIDELIKIKCPESIKIIFDLVISSLKEKKYEDAHKNLDIIKQINRNFFQQIYPILIRISDVFTIELGNNRIDSKKISQNDGTHEIQSNLPHYFQQFLLLVQQKNYGSAKDLLNNMDKLDKFVRFALSQNPIETENFFKEILPLDRLNTEIKVIKKLVSQEKIEQVNQKIKKLQQSDKILAYSFYFFFKEQNQKITHPDLKIKKQNTLKLDSLKSISPNSNEIYQNYQNFINALTDNDIQEGLFQLEVIWEQDKQFILKEQEKLKGISNHLNKFLEEKLLELNSQKIKAKLNKKSKFMVQYEQICLHLGKNEISEAIKILNHILARRDIEIIEFFAIINKNRFFTEQILEFITEQVLFDSVSPLQIKKNVCKILKELKSNFEQLKDDGIQKKQILMEEEFNKIYWENPEFCQLFSNYIASKQDIPTCFQIIFSQYKGKDKKEVCKEDLKKFSALLPKLQKKLNVMDFMAINVNQTLIELQEIFLEEIRNKKLIIPELLIQILFDLIKKKINFDSIIQGLSKVHPQKIFTQTLLLNYLLENSDMHLKTLLIQSCSYFLPLPLLTYSFNDGNMERIIYPELYYVYEQCLGIFSFKFSTNQNKTIKRCSKILNDAFSKSFELHQNNYSNYGTIQIQFDMNFSEPCYMPVVDVQGIQSIDIIRKFYPYFEIFIIHYSSLEKEEVENELTKLKELNPFSSIISIEHSDESIEYSLYSKDTSHHNFLRCNFDKMEDLQYQLFLKELRNIVLNFLQNTDKANKYVSNIDKRQSKSLKFIDLLEKFSVNVEVLQESNRLISSILSEIQINKENLHSESFQPMNYYFQQLCEANNDIKEAKTQEEINDIRNKKEIFEQQLKIRRQSQIIMKIQELSNSQNFLGNINVISKLIKGFITNEFAPLLNKRSQYRIDIQKQELSNEEKEKKMNEIQLLTRKIEKKWFSQEFMIRELYLRQRFNENNFQEKKDFETLIFNQYQQAQPFEIIDGNNLSFIQEVYENQFKEDNEKILVVSVIGPQSSGKSLLLNFLFGTQFQSATGRCTKGVYGSLMKINGVGDNHYQKILLLDTEGIQASEARDERFDKRIVFYILCISHVVLICNRGEMNSSMSEIIKLATHSISDLRENVLQEPQVNIIMNMLAEIDEAALEQSIQAVSNSILMGENKEKINKIFQITKENLFILPFAFNRSGNDKFVVNQPSSEFAIKLEPLRNKILNKIFEGDHQGNNYNLKEWFKFASGFWAFTQKFEGITFYNNLQQKQQDSKLLEFSQALFDEEFKDIQNFFSNEQLVENFVNQLEFSEQQQVQKVKKALHQKIKEDFQQKQDIFERKFINYCSENKINQKIVNKRENQLQYLLRSVLTEYKNHANEIYAKLLNLKSHIMTDASFQQYINECLRDQDKYTYSEAKIKYKSYYKKIEEEYKRTIENEDIKQEQFELIRELYKNQFPDKNMQRKDEEIEILE